MTFVVCSQWNWHWHHVTAMVLSVVPLHSLDQDDLNVMCKMTFWSCDYTGASISVI